VIDNTIQPARIEVDPEQPCPIAPVVDIVFSRWTTPILWALNEYGRHRFVELDAASPRSHPRC
jgi:DNA-binding HxlR family transcriptional regulator